MKSAAYDALHHHLVRWGEWMELHDGEGSLPKMVAFMRIFADQPAGHRILCSEMPKRVRWLHVCVIKLPPHFQQILKIWYGLNLKANGAHWTDHEKARRLRISSNALRMRVNRARKCLYVTAQQDSLAKTLLQ